ncbi:MAG: phosphoribosylanthranilate isomerase [Acidobacteriota bacterium]
MKVCGVTTVADARLAVDLGADLVGLNFYPPSPRHLEVGPAREISRAIADRALKVGVFVDRPVDEIDDIDRRVGLDLIQLHGDESPAQVAHWGERALPAIRVPARQREPLDAGLLEDYPRAWGFLFDIRHAAYGGTGIAWNYDTLAPLEGSRPRLVAGGIDAPSVRRALAASGATGVDVCSGVESAPGLKDPEKMRRFFEEVRHGARD